MSSDTDNLDEIGKEGSRPRKGRLRRPRLVVVIGLWMLCFPTMILNAIVAAEIFFNYRTRSNFLLFWLAVAWFLVTASILYRVTRNYVMLPPMQDDISADYEDYSDEKP